MTVEQWQEYLDKNKDRASLQRYIESNRFDGYDGETKRYVQYYVVFAVYNWSNEYYGIFGRASVGPVTNYGTTGCSYPVMLL